jgi:hypothetical protein
VGRMEPAERPIGEWVQSVRHVRSQVTEAADLKSTIAFQNDVNALLAAIAALDAPGPRIPSGVEALFGILPSGEATLRKLRHARDRLRDLIFTRPSKPPSGPRPRPLRTAP